MHNYNQHTDLIKRLRALNKIGQTNDQNADANAAKALAKSKTEYDSLISQAGNLQNVLNAAGPLLSNFGDKIQDLQHGISIAMEQQIAYNQTIVDLVKNVTYFDQVEASISKTLGISTKKSYELTQVYGNYINKLQTTRANLDKYRAVLDDILPLQSENLALIDKTIDAKTRENKTKNRPDDSYTEVLLKSQQHLQQSQKLTAEQSRDYLLYTEGSGKNIGEQLGATQHLAAAWEEATKQTGVYNTILNEISSLSATIRSEYSRMGGNLEIAVLKSKQLGFSMEKLDTVGKHLLNIEESVGKEIEYQLISGRRLVDTNGRSLTMRFREAKLMGNGIKMAETMNDLVATQGDIIEKGSFSQKQALADALGLSVEELVVAKQRLEINKKVAAARGMDFEKFSALTKHEQQAEIEQFKKAESKKAKGTSKDDQQAAVIENAKANLKALESLQTKEIDLQTPAERSAVALESMRDKGVFLQMKGTAYKDFGLEKKLVDEKKGVPSTLANQILANEYALKNIGKMQTNLKLFETELENMSNSLKKLPLSLANAFADVATNAVKKAMQAMAGSYRVLGLDITSPIKQTAPGHAKNIPTEALPRIGSTTKQKDALIMNDGIVQFHPSDKFMQVNDSTMIAGTSVDGNKKLAKSISGGGMDMNKIVPVIQNAISNSIKSVPNGMDMNKLISVIQTAINGVSKSSSYNADKTSGAGVDMNKLISVIQTAFSGVQITVNVDPMKIDREIKFRTTTINSKQGRV